MSMRRTNCVVVEIDGSSITNDDSFHVVFAEALGFPGFYGKNMNAWIDCLSYVDDPSSEMTGITIEAGEILVLEINAADAFKRNCPATFDTMIECVGHVNERSNGAVGSSVISVAFNSV